MKLGFFLKEAVRSMRRNPAPSFAALSCVLVTTLVLGVYFIIAWAPASGLLWNAIGFHPEKTSLGRLHQRYVKELLN